MIWSIITAIVGYEVGKARELRAVIAQSPGELAAAAAAAPPAAPQLPINAPANALSPGDVDAHSSNTP